MSSFVALHSFVLSFGTFLPGSLTLRSYQTSDNLHRETVDARKVFFPTPRTTMPRVTSLTKGKMPAVYPDVRTGRPELFPPGVLGDEELEIERDYTCDNTGLG